MCAAFAHTKTTEVKTTREDKRRKGYNDDGGWGAHMQDPDKGDLKFQ